MENILVAKSYQDLPKVGEVFISSGRQYINVQLKSGKLKMVRVYSKVEYAKMYPDEAVPTNGIPSYLKGQKKALGFENGYITIFKGDTYGNLGWFQKSIARYARLWGWYIVSTDEIPDDLPATVTPVRLNWEDVSDNGETLKNETEVIKFVESLMYDEDPSEYVGEIGDRLDLIVKIERAIQTEGRYGISTIHTMRDENGNVYLWATSTKTLVEGNYYSMRGTVKDHSVYKNTKQTVLTRCLKVTEVQSFEG